MGKLWRKTGAWAAALAIVLALALPVQAATDERRPAVAEVVLDWFGTVLDGASDWLVSIGKLGGGIDPDGESTSTQDDSPTGDPELGGGIDPDG